MTAAGAVAIGFAGLALVLAAIAVRRRRGGINLRVWWDGNHQEDDDSDEEMSG
jgi:hypothetical protein